MFWLTGCWFCNQFWISNISWIMTLTYTNKASYYTKIFNFCFHLNSWKIKSTSVLNGNQNDFLYFLSYLRFYNNTPCCNLSLMKSLNKLVGRQSETQSWSSCFTEKIYHFIISSLENFFCQFFTISRVELGSRGRIVQSIDNH